VKEVCHLQYYIKFHKFKLWESEIRYHRLEAGFFDSFLAIQTFNKIPLAAVKEAERITDRAVKKLRFAKPQQPRQPFCKS